MGGIEECAKRCEGHADCCVFEYVFEYVNQHSCVLYKECVRDSSGGSSCQWGDYILCQKSKYSIVYNM